MTSQLDRKIVAATFSSPDGGTRAAAALAGAVPEKLANTAVFAVTPEGKAKFLETKDWGAGRGAVVGGIVGLMVGPLAMLTLGSLGALAAKLRDTGFNDQQLEELGRGLKPNTSAIVVDVAAEAVDVAKGLLGPLGVQQLVVTEVTADVASIFAEKSASPVG